MRMMTLLLALATILAGFSIRAAENFVGTDMIDLKLTLPHGDTYMRGPVVPVENLTAELTLINKTKKAAPPAKEGERASNPDSLGFAYIEPRLGPYDSISFVIVKLPEEGETPVEGAKPVAVPRLSRPSVVSNVNWSPEKYVAPGESSQPHVLPLGQDYAIIEPGQYSVKAVIRAIGDSSKPDKCVESNEEKFRVLPYREIDQKVDALKTDLDEYEFNNPKFDYMIYRLKTANDYDQLYTLQRISANGGSHWEWTPLCSVKLGTQVQVAQIAPKKVAVLAVHGKGDAGLYTLDFSGFGVKVGVKNLQPNGNTVPKLKVEAGAVSAE